MATADIEPVVRGPAPERAEQPIDCPGWPFSSFDPTHDSTVEPMHGYPFGIHGYPVNQPRQPVVRVSWDKAIAFRRWLSYEPYQAVFNVGFRMVMEDE